ncbi:hypothetical protein THAOC_16480, partial [Thalassiosira oceanica]
MLESLLYSDEEEESPIESGENAHLIEYLKAWFMPPLKKGSDESRAATHGHRVEKRFLKQAFECIKESEGNFGASIDAIYAPGLVSSRHAMHLRDSADGVVMLTDTESGLTCLPVEVKSRCSPRTYDKEAKQVEDVRRMLEDAGGLPVDGDDNRPLFAFFNVMIDTAADDDDTSGNSDNGERHYTVNPLLRAAIPDANELIQIMHHAVTWEVDSCFFVVGGYSRVLAIYEVRFPEELLDAYEDISSDLFDNDLKSLYLPSNEMPRLSDEWKQAIDSDSVKRLKLDEDSFLQRLAIWRVLNVDRSNDARKKRRIQYQRSIELPLPRTVNNGIIPMTHGLWNNFKGGSDTSTHVADNVQESVGFRTDNNAA